MSTEHQCPKCGAVLSADAAKGLCPRCLLGAALSPILADAGKPTIRTEPSFEDEPSERIDRYKILQKLGEGGCGVVYMAEQTEPVRRRVALKVIKLGMDTKQVIARFEAERQALALMDHPNIAKVLDAGTTEKGRPYFVMELVKGIRITDYCDQNHLPTSERLALFTQVCQAIQHAHQKGIIHRDIKPSNILVTLHDGVPVPKVIDFGIAKATEQSLTEKTVFTAFGQFMGTPAYMSPEQAELSGLDIDTRSDIYALGVLLYELLTGKTPFDAKELLQAGLDEMRRRIREEEPMRPSTRLSTMVVADLTEVAERRQSEPAKLTRFIRGDLDWIVMKCLEKDRTRRYETANGLAMDLRRHLNNEPVVACPPSAAYRFRKLVRRNKLTFAATTAVTAALIIGLGLSTILFLREAKARSQAQEQERQAREAEAEATAILEFFQRHVLSVARPEGEPNAVSRDVTVREALVQAEKQILATFSNQPMIEAQLRETLGETFWYQGDSEKAVAQFERSLELFRAKLGPKAKHTLTAMNNLALAYDDTGQFEKALPLAETVVEWLQETQGAKSRETLIAMHSLASIYHTMGQDEKALPLELKTLELRKSVLGLSDSDTLSSMDGLGMLYRSLGQISNAIAICEETVAIAQTNLGPDDPMTLSAMGNLASSYQQSGRIKEALPLRKEVVERRKRIYGPESPQTLISMMNLATTYERDGDFNEAIELHEETLRLRRLKLRSDDPAVYFSMHNLAVAYSKGGRLPDAVELVKKTIEGRQRLLGPDHPDTLASMSCLAVFYQDDEKFAEAIQLAEQVLGLAEAKLGRDHSITLEYLHKLAFAYYEAGQWSNAIPRLLEAMNRYKAQSGGASSETLTEMTRLAAAYSQAGQSNQSAELWLGFVEVQRSASEGDALAVAGTLAQLVMVRLQRNEPFEAEQPARACLALREKFIPDDWRTFNSQSALGGSLLGQKKYHESEPLLLSGYEGMKQREHKIPDNGKIRLKESLERLVRLYEAIGQSEKVTKWKKKLTEHDKPGADDPSNVP